MYTFHLSFPKSTACFFTILVKKILGVETDCLAAPFYLDNRELFVKVGAGSPRPKTKNNKR